MNDNAHATPGFGASAQLGGQPQQPLRLLRLADVMDRVAMGKSTIYALVARNEFPAPMHLGRASRWLEEEVNQWIHQRSSSRPEAAHPEC